MKKKYFSLIFVLVFCIAFLVGCKSYEVSYINEHLNNDGCINAKYTRAIYSGEVLLFEEKIESVKSATGFDQTITTKELSGLNDDIGYITNVETASASTEDLKVKLELKEECFEKGHLKVYETGLTGILEDSKASEVLGI